MCSYNMPCPNLWYGKFMRRGIEKGESGMVIGHMAK